MENTIDINCDMGEGFGAYVMGRDADCMPHISSANVACGFHAGDFNTMRNTVELARQAGVAVGAHPGLPDLQGFGRRAMALAPQEVHDLTVYQVGALLGFCRAAEVSLTHVKPHGALSHMASADAAIADAVCQAVAAVDRRLLFFSPFGSKMTAAAERAGLTVVHEVYADRSYQDDGSLTPRSRPGALIESLEQAMEQVLSMVLHGRVRSMNGIDVPIRADSICVHGDQQEAVAFAAALRAELERQGVRVLAPRGNGSK